MSYSAGELGADRGVGKPLVVLGPIPVLSIEHTGGNATVTYSGTLQSRDDLVQGSWTDVVEQSTNFFTALKTWQIPANTSKKFYRAYKTYLTKLRLDRTETVPGGR
jgi:hypothetical protein